MDMHDVTVDLSVKTSNSVFTKPAFSLLIIQNKQITVPLNKFIAFSYTSSNFEICTWITFACELYTIKNLILEPNVFQMF